MAPTVEFTYRDVGRGVQPLELLRRLDASADELTWAVLAIEAWAHPGSHLNVLALECEVAELPTGKHYRFVDVVGLLEQLAHVMNLVLVGCADDVQVPTLHAPDEDYERCDYVIEVIDGSVWKVGARHPEYLERVRELVAALRSGQGAAHAAG